MELLHFTEVCWKCICLYNSHLFFWFRPSNLGNELSNLTHSMWVHCAHNCWKCFDDSFVNAYFSISNGATTYVISGTWITVIWSHLTTLLFASFPNWGSLILEEILIDVWQDTSFAIAVDAIPFYRFLLTQAKLTRARVGEHVQYSVTSRGVQNSSLTVRHRHNDCILHCGNWVQYGNGLFTDRFTS